MSAFERKRTLSRQSAAAIRQLLLVCGSISMVGCATVDPSRIKLDVEPVTQICGASDREVPVRMSVRNDSQGKLEVWIEPGLHQPPYALSWLSYKILSDGGKTDWVHGPGGHGPMPPSTLSIGPGDSVEVVGSLYGLTPADYAKHFQIEFGDTAGHTFVSSSFKVCLEKWSLSRTEIPGSSDFLIAATQACRHE